MLSTTADWILMKSEKKRKFCITMKRKRRKKRKEKMEHVRQKKTQE